MCRLIGINAVSLIFALVANLALLFNVARRLSFSIAQPITIVCWYIASFILIGLIAAAGHAPSMQLPQEQNPALTQAFYYAILAAGIYMIISSMMVVTVFGAYRGHYSNNLELTVSQRTLMLQTISYLVYLLGGAAVYAHIENWLFLNGVWWANFTLLTIGIGDFYPRTHLGKSLLFPFAIGGIVILGLVVGSIRSLVLERGKQKLGARMIEKKREKVVDQIQDGSNEVILSPFSKNFKLKTGNKPEVQKRRSEFKLMRRIQDHAASRRKWTSLIISALAWLTLWLVGAAIFWVADRDMQDVTYFDMIYFAYVSLLTIGYGDYTLVSNAGKPVFVLWSLLAVPTLTILISNMGDTVVKGIRDLTLWIGEFTVLPREGSTVHKLKEGAQKAKNAKLFGRSGDTTEENPGGIFLPESDRDLERQEGGKPSSSTATKKAIDRGSKEVETTELADADQARRKGDKLSEDAHLHHFLLMKEIRKVMKDVHETPPHKYPYHEWAWFMRLLGEDERDAKFHQKPIDEGDATGRDMQAADEGASREDRAAGTGTSTQWSWLGAKSPLMGEMEEAEWILDRLSEKLEQELEGQRYGGRDGKGKRREIESLDQELERGLKQEETTKAGASAESSDTLSGADL